MLGHKTRTEAVKETLASRAELATRLARDRKFRKQLISAIGHGANARRTVRSRTKLIPVAARLAGDPRLQKELKSAANDLRSAWGRMHRKRSHTRRNVALGVVAAAGLTAAAFFRKP